MIFRELRLKGAYLIESEPWEDERGFFARSFCAKTFEKFNLWTRFVQNSISLNKKKGTLRGMHYQTAPHEEVKLVSCFQGAVYDVIIDLRPNSTTFQQWLALELNASDWKTLYVPQGFAHGFQTLEDNSLLLYQISEFYYPQFSRGIYYGDPRFTIRWPLPVTSISRKDQHLKLFVE
ncbi:MAG: dTDP-4-dehydrorhamnose 3,5-epimerase [Bacillota bacterium]|nr:dTDP-4-dehydrorhamnose 3,5-epimerase [Bacillota bacterium]MDW7684822.1 dTDP-4-dehydrorhamnose 3,5-epimerase [Bacillota bacterium]